MNHLYARAVFFVADAEKARRYYLDKLGFEQEWEVVEEGTLWVFQVHLFGFELILNQTWGPSKGKEGHGRVYIGLDDEQIKPVLDHIKKYEIPTERVDWGQPTLVVRDLDGNELYFWDWPEKQAS